MFFIVVCILVMVFLLLVVIFVLMLVIDSDLIIVLCDMLMLLVISILSNESCLDGDIICWEVFCLMVMVKWKFVFFLSWFLI